MKAMHESALQLCTAAHAMLKYAPTLCTMHMSACFFCHSCSCGKSCVLCRPWWLPKSPLSPQTICYRLQIGQSMAHMKQDLILKRLGLRRSGTTLRSKLCKHDQTAISARQDGNVTAEVIRLLSSTVLIECESLVQVSVPSSLLVQNKQCIVRDFVPCQVVLLQLTYVL